MVRFRVLLLLYRQVWPLTVATSLSIWMAAGCPLPASDHFLSFITKFFWLRSVSQVVIWYLFRSTTKKGFVFYHHFGFSELQLALGLYLFDLLLFIVWLYVVNLFVR